jgi:hypothetical protein
VGARPCSPTREGHLTLDIRLRFVAMRERLEEEPDPDDEPDETSAVQHAPGTFAPISDGGREYEYRTDLVTTEQVVDGSTLSDQLTRASADGWDLVDIISAGDRHAILLRRVKRAERTSRAVGFSAQHR